MRMALMLLIVLVTTPAALAQKTAADCASERLGTSISAVVDRRAGA